VGGRLIQFLCVGVFWMYGSVFLFWIVLLNCFNWLRQYDAPYAL
jgi:hypothetical protein